MIWSRSQLLRLCNADQGSITDKSVQIWQCDGAIWVDAALPNQLAQRHISHGLDVSNSINEHLHSHPPF